MDDTKYGLPARLRGSVLDAALRLIAGAHRRDGRILDRDKEPRFSIPARPEVDDDFVVLNALRDAANDIDDLRAQNGRIRELEDALREIAGMKVGEAESVKYIQACRLHEMKKIAREALNRKGQNDG